MMLTRTDIKQLFGPKGIRTAAEQRAFLHEEAQRLAIRNAAAAARVPEYTVNKKRRGIDVTGPMFITESELERALIQIRGTTKAR